MSDEGLALDSAQEARPSERAESGTLLLICAFVFCSQFQPSEPFLVDYLIDDVSLTSYQVYGEVLNLYIYARLPCIALVGLLSEVPSCTCRNLLVAGAVWAIAGNVATRFGTTLLAQQMAEFAVAAAVASRLAVMGLVFAVTLPSQSQKCVHMVHATLLFSNFCSAVLGEVLRDIVGIPLSRLFEISICSQALALGFALQLPSRGSALGSVELHQDIDGEASSCKRPSSLASLRRPLVDLWLLMKLRVILWWTAWALAMNPAHGLMLTYWQSLVRQKHFLVDHNGYALASMYLVAGILTFLSRNASSFRSLTSVLVIGSMLGAGLICSQIVASSWEVQLYGWLLVYQCVFHLGTAVSIFQVGSQVTQVQMSKSSPRSGLEDNCRPTMGGSHLTLLLSMTGILGSVNENAIQIFINRLRPIEARLQRISMILAVVAFLLMLARSLETLMSWRRAASARHLDGAVEDISTDRRRMNNGTWSLHASSSKDCPTATLLSCDSISNDPF